ncbi:MAG TPA: cellulose binding domain-containing protein, partial [Polyangiaceae bacterium]|nr:cellulose binding domain-containing protein [Polyangiaceae bacterium]
AQACAHQSDGEIINAETDHEIDSARGGSGGSGSGGSGSIVVPPTMTGKGGTSSTTGGKGGSGGTGGTADSAGSSGTGGGGGSGGTAGSEGGGQPAPDTGFVVQYMASQTGDTSPAISCQLAIRNDSSEAVPLSEFTLRYYFTNELTVDPDLQMFWAHLTGGAGFSFTMAQVDMETPATHANAYFEFTIAAGAPVLEPNATAELAWQSFNGASEVNLQTNDYSFDASKTAYTIWDHVELLRNGEPYWGTPP